MEIYKTADAPQDSRASYWSDVYSSNVAPVHVNPSDERRFKAELRLGWLGPLEFACVRSQATCAERTQAQAARATERQLGFIMTVRGEGFASHCGRESALEAGDIMLSDVTEPMFCGFKTSMYGITVRASESTVAARLPGFDSMRGIRLPASTGLTQVAVEMAKCLSSKLDGEISAPYATAVATTLLDVIATSYALAASQPITETSIGNARKACIFSFVEENLSDPDLTPYLVASALKISPRYLRKLMAEHGESTSSLILRRRLEEAAKQLSRDPWGARSITDVAFSLGFNSSAHFARVFRERYGVCPRDYRTLSGDPPLVS